MGQQTAFVIHPDNRLEPLPRPPQLCLVEACNLVAAIGIKVIFDAVLPLNRPRAGTFIGKGYAMQLKEQIAALDEPPLIVLNCALSPVQQRNLEVMIDCKVIDRKALILEIFGARASTHAGRLQVELAALIFQRSRLVRSWTHLERQRGGGGFLGGPGERQIELDRRMLVQRMEQIKTELGDVERTRGLQRRNRERTETPIIAFVGYTNAGKSTLFNKITHAGVMAKDMLFATLDPVMRMAALPSGRDIILTDTVGFISQLPIELIESFKSTLEEITFADIIVHVHDMSSALLMVEAADVTAVLHDIGIDDDTRDAKVIHVFNKADCADENALAMAKSFPDCVILSALNGDGIDDFYKAIEAKLSLSERKITVHLTPMMGDVRAWLHAHGQVQSLGQSDDGIETVEVLLSRPDAARFTARFPTEQGVGVKWQE